MGKRRWLKREIVVETAVRLANESGGYADLTLTAVAAELDVRVPSLYNHVANLNDLHQGMRLFGLETMLAQMREAVGDKVGEEALLAAAIAYRRFAKQYHGIYSLILTAPDPEQTALMARSAEMLQLLQLLLATMGLRDDDALHAIRGLRALLHGFASLEASDGFKLALDLDESFRRLVQTFIDGIRQ